MVAATTGDTKFEVALASLAGARSRMVREVEAWSAINSGSGNLAGLSRMADVIEKAFAPLGAELTGIALDPVSLIGADGEETPVERAPILHFRKYGQANRRVVLSIHYDTVFEADHPFQVPRLIDEDTMNGPGVADAKGGLLVMLEALKCLEASPVAGGVGWDVVLVPDEETGSLASAPHLARLAEGAEFGMIYEPALEDGTLAGARKGSGNFSVVFRGLAAHAGREFAAGRSAIVAAARFVAALDDLNTRIGSATFNSGAIEGGGPVNVVPDLAIVRFNIRVSDAAEQQAAEAAIHDLVRAANTADGISAVLAGSVNRPPKPLTGPTLALYDWVKDLGAGIGIGIQWKPTGGCCDGNNLAAAGIPNIDTLGVRGGLIHSAKEYVKLSSFEERARLSALILMKTAAGEGPVLRS